MDASSREEAVRNRQPEVRRSHASTGQYHWFACRRGEGREPTVVRYRGRLVDIPVVFPRTSRVGELQFTI